MKPTFAQIIDAGREDLRARLFRKVPSWRDADIEIPSSINVEQCSSEATGRYKAALAERIAFGNQAEIHDLTGGLGVDSWSFALKGRKVHYNEMDERLSLCAKSNFTSLGVGNISVSSVEVSAQTLPELLGNCSEDDIVYLDPARRDKTGGKVFLIEDCSPDITGLKNEIFAKARNILVKLSPMADISMVAERLGKEVREIHVIGAGKECKELLVWLEKGWNGGYSITVSDENGIFTFTRDQEACAPLSLPGREEKFVGKFLYEPGPSYMKAGAFKLLCQRGKFTKLGHFTHLYLSETKGSRILETLHFNGSNLKLLGKRYPKCEVTARNVMLTSEQMRKKMGVSGGGDIHVYAVKCDFDDGTSEKLLLVTSRF